MLNYTFSAKNCFRNALIVGLLILTSFRALIPITYYVMNVAYIQEALCVNKDNKTMQCNGKCFLANELTDTVDHQEKSTHKSVKVVKVLEVFIPVALPIIVTLFNTDFSPRNSTIPWLSTYAYIYSKWWLKPPII